uniref:Uncharacterized protein n=1 Tax=Salix viminalis TaxID=40686 RepID=A0A6N2KHA6_SALVM
MAITKMPAITERQPGNNNEDEDIVDIPKIEESITAKTGHKSSNLSSATATYLSSNLSSTTHAAITDLDATTSFFGVYDGHGGKNCKFQSDFIVFLADLWLCPYMNKVKVIAAMFNSSKVVAKFCSKFLHRQVLKNEEYAAGDIGTSVQKAFFRMDEMMRGQRGWRELEALGDKINKFTGMIEGLIWSPRCGGSNEQPDDWAVLTLTSLDQLVVAQPAYSLSRDHKPDLRLRKKGF